MGKVTFVDAILDEFRGGCKPLSCASLHGAAYSGCRGCEEAAQRLRCFTNEELNEKKGHEGGNMVAMERY
jgi:hypothetical protein